MVDICSRFVKICHIFILSHFKHNHLSIRQITQQCKEQNYSIDLSYICKLQISHLPVTFEELSKSLDKALEANMDRLSPLFQKIINEVQWLKEL